jgi:predicted nuclease of predicted toxin-antitoxin system
VIRFLVDECVPAEVADVLRSRGHEVTHVIEHEALRAASDIDHVAGADQLKAVIVTNNYRDYQRIIARAPPGNVLRFRHAGLVALALPEGRQAARVAELLELIEVEYRRRQNMTDKRLIVELHAARLVVL